jgi:hypothetical protein
MSASQALIIAGRLVLSGLTLKDAWCQHVHGHLGASVASSIEYDATQRCFDLIMAWSVDRLGLHSARPCPDLA